MNIIILGAGQVGSDIACTLASEANDVTVVDLDEPMLNRLQSRLDIRTVPGNASSPVVLQQAGIENADLLLAVTSSDEINMMACQVARSLFSTQKCLARIRSADYLHYPVLFSPKAIPVDYLISPEKLVTQHIRHLISEPGVLQVLDFLGGKAKLVAVEARSDGPLTGQRLDALARLLPERVFRLVALFRDDQSLPLTDDTRIHDGDEVFLVAATAHVGDILAGFQSPDRRNRRIIIAGGGNIGEALARSLEKRCQVKLIDIDEQRGQYLAQSLENTMVLLGDAADADLLQQEGIDSTDIYCALTDDDEANILSSMLARRLGAHRTLCLINRSSYVDIAEGSNIDIAVSPSHVTIGALLAHIRRADVLTVHALRRGAAEALEIKVHGDKRTSRVVGRRIDELGLNRDVQVGLIARGDSILVPSDDLTLTSDDQVVLFLPDKRHIKAIEKLFQVGVTFV